MTPDEDSSESPSEFRRRDLLMTMGAGGGLAGLAGCQGLFSQTKRYVAEPAMLDSKASALGFTLQNDQQIQTKRQESVGGSTLDIEVVSYVARYSGSSTDFGTAATPQVKEAGQVLNPVAKAPLSDLVKGKSGGAYISKTPLADKSWKRGPFREDQRKGTLLGQQATLETYAGITDQGNLAVVSIARVIDDDDAVIVGGSREWTPSGSSKQALNNVSNDKRFADHISKIIKTMPHVIRKSATGTGTPTATKKVGINKANGSDFAPDRQALYFVQESGELVRYDLVRSVQSSPASGTVVIEGTFSFNFDNGVGGSSSNRSQSSERDIFWRIRDSTTRWLQPENGAEIAYLGNVSYGDVTPESLPRYDYTSDHLEVTKSGSKLQADSVFVVKTSDGNYAKAQVIDRGGSNNTLELRYETYQLSSPLTTIGTGYNVPDDIELVGNGNTAYVTEQGLPPDPKKGTLLKVDLDNADRSSAGVVAKGFGIAHQMELEPEKGQAHVVTDKKIVRIDLGSGNVTDVYTGLKQGKGLVFQDGTQFAFVTDQNTGPNAGWLYRVDLSSGQKEVMLTDLSQGGHLTWTDDAQDTIIVPDMGPSSITRYDLVDNRVSSLVQNPPNQPASVQFTEPGGGYIFGTSQLVEFDLSANLFGTAGPMFKGIGHIPISDITQQPNVSKSEAGYANTSGPAYPLEVDEAPFGGRLPLKLDHYEAYVNNNARYYRVFVDGTVESRPLHALKWDRSKDEFTSTKITPSANGYYPVRKPGTIWFRSDLGYRLPTGNLSNGLHDLRVAFYSGQSKSSKVGEDSVEFRVDNDGPEARLGRIFHKLSGGSEEVVDACAIVDKATKDFKFEVTAHDQQKHLRAWRLRALWGHGKSDTVTKETFSNNGSGSDWAGPVTKKVGDSGGGYWTAQKKRCAHTFFLHAWGRTIDGHSYIHRSGDHKSLTLLIP
jgi:sugar lactone lactonase YvrE